VTARRARTLVGFGLAAALATAPFAREARAYSFVDQVPEDPCVRSLSLEPGDTGPEAQKAQRACRLARFEQSLAEKRRQEVAQEQAAREAWLQRWMAATQPARVLHPMAIEGFAGSGIVNYGLGFSWNVMRQLELAARIGQRKMSCTDQFSSSADCTRTTWGAGARWILLGNQDFSPFVGAAFSSTSASLKIIQFNPQTGQTEYLDGKGRAHSVSTSAGLQLAVNYVRLSLEYLYEHVFYTGANLNDMQHTPSESLGGIWAQSLKQDRHGVRFQVGIAF
jgi:hypothetical protein